MSSFDKVLVGVLIGIMLILTGCIVWNQNLEREKKNWEHNYHVLQDSVEVINTKYGETLFENGSLIIERNGLEEALGISQKQVKEYEKKLNSKLAYISKLEAQLKVKDTVKVTEVVHDTLTNSYSMSYDDNWLSFDQTFSLFNPEKPTFEVFNIGMNVPLKVGMTNDYKIFVTSPNPYFNITNIDGAIIDGSQFAKKKSRFGVGIYGGFGFQYGLLTQRIDLGPQLGFGVMYIIF